MAKKKVGGRSGTDNKKRKEHYKSLARQVREAQEEPETNQPEQYEVRVIAPMEKTRSEQYLLESSAETYSERTPPAIYGKSKKHISTTTEYVNEEGKHPHAIISTETDKPWLYPITVRQYEKGFQFKTLVLTKEDKGECERTWEMVEVLNFQDFYKTLEAKQDFRIRDQFSAMERTFLDKMPNIKRHLAGGGIYDFSN